MYSYHIVLVIFLLLVSLFLYREGKNVYLSENKDQRKYLFYTLIALLIGIFIRTILPSYPFGIFADEAIGGYDTWCLANYGVDSHLASYPVYFESWGSGQTAMYGYFALPFVKIFGLSLPVFRLPMMLISSVSLVLFYYSLRKSNQSPLLIFSIILLFVISPWHIMMSRWAFDCNLCPNLLLIAVSFVILLFHEDSSRKRFIYALISSFCIAIAAYAYGVSWFMLPLFCILLFGYLIKSKKLSFLQVAVIAGLMLLFLVPLILFAIVMFFDKEPFQLGIITITKLEVSRAAVTTVVQSEVPLLTFLSYAKRGLIFLLTGDDGWIWNNFPYWGQFYNILGLPFIAYTLYHYIKNKKRSPLDWIFLFWFISVIPLILLVEPAGHHWNTLWPPLLYFFAKGVYLLINKYPRVKNATLIMLVCLGVAFGVKYFTYYSISRFAKDNYGGFIKGLDEVVPFGAKLDVDTIYYIDVSYALPLFYHPENPYEYVKMKRRKSGTGLVLYDYGRNYFDIPLQLNPSHRTAYIVRNKQIEQADISAFNVYQGKYYTVLWNE